MWTRALALLQLLRKAAWQIDARLDEYGGFDYDALGQALDSMTGNVHSPSAEDAVVIEICASAASVGVEDPAIEMCASKDLLRVASFPKYGANGADANAGIRGTKRKEATAGSTPRKKPAFDGCVCFGANLEDE